MKIGDGDVGSLIIYDDNIVFSPPLYKQRYQKVHDKIASVSKGTLTKVLDVGCAELKFFSYLRSISGVQEIILLDKSDQILEDNVYRISPLTSDHIFLRELPLNVKAVCGDVTEYDPLLCGTQVVTMIEVIEHVQKSELPALIKCVFQYIKPKLVVITTPNADFNKYFPGHEPGTFRHWDHKFEWTAEEFHQWCQDIIQDNCDYSLEYSGCGLGPEDIYCTQIAVFLQSVECQEQLLSCIVRDPLCKESQYQAEITESATVPDIRKSSYRIIAEFDYPVDSRTQDEKDRDHTLAKFYSLMTYLRTSERDADSQFNWGWPTEENTETKCTDSHTHSSEVHPQGASSISEDTVNADDGLIFFSTDYVENEEAMSRKKCTATEYFFYIVDNKYAVIPMKSLSAWVNNNADHEISPSLISVTVAEDCFETSGSGEEWQGKVKLWEESYCSSDASVEDCVNDDDDDNSDQEGWFADDEQHTDWDKLAYDDDDDNVNTAVDLPVEDWDIPDVPDDPSWI